jgi:hypothetical protein
MMLRLGSRLSWVYCILGFIAVGIFSRIVHTGVAVFDKYLGDALYAMVAYAILRLLWPPAAAAVWASVGMTAIELFQLTMIPAHLLASTNLAVRLCAHLLGVTFSFRDLLAYAVGIGCIYLVDCQSRPLKRSPADDPAPAAPHSLAERR